MKFTLEADGSSGSPELERYIAGRLQAAFTIFKERQAKYGSGNIARRGPVGVLVRLDDKLARLDRVFMEGKADAATDESVEDTCLDIANYALILLACHAGQWPGWTPRTEKSAGGKLPLLMERELRGTGRGGEYAGPPLHPVTPEQDSAAAVAAAAEMHRRLNSPLPGWWRNDTNRPQTT